MTTNNDNPSPDPKDQSFLEATEEAKGGLLSDFIEFMGENAKWWLAPFLIVFLVLGLLLILGGASAIAPFIYTLF